MNRVLGGDLRWQTLPVPFEVYADGIDLVVFEEFGAGRALLHLVDEVERNALMQDEAYRRRFRKDYETRFTSRVWQRDFHDAFIVACPDASLVGQIVRRRRRRARHASGRRVPRSRRRARHEAPLAHARSRTIARARSRA